MHAGFNKMHANFYMYCLLKSPYQFMIHHRTGDIPMDYMKTPVFENHTVKICIARNEEDCFYFGWHGDTSRIIGTVLIFDKITGERSYIEGRYIRIRNKLASLLDLYYTYPFLFESGDTKYYTTLTLSFNNKYYIKTYKNSSPEFYVINKKFELIEHSEDEYKTTNDCAESNEYQQLNDTLILNDPIERDLLVDFTSDKYNPIETMVLEDMCLEICNVTLTLPKNLKKLVIRNSGKKLNYYMMCKLVDVWRFTHKIENIFENLIIETDNITLLKNLELYVNCKVTYYAHTEHLISQNDSKSDSY